ncbi:hypothetical protein D5R81_13045 [Parashewanella spongiae]|uniref:Superinfection exclusion protein B n=1 Tax=Parashewanella spongiae TaxID=342950 RepID=A0A3A6TIG9_9GAMM|nr:superinfection exclusion B family protein [Parashewanella spongiae]MCL1079345.1 superinfection exclusion B family protein [Parashewanella spongiae]RJY11477.1 hypothetical protein D5R81_13045 [Parashewanella spongiae]
MVTSTLNSIKQFQSQQLVFRTMLWLVILCSGLLFLPASVISKLGLDATLQQYNHLIGFGLIIGSAYFFSRVCDYLLDTGINHYGNKRVIERIESKISVLDIAERAVLREFFLQSTSILTLPKEDIAVKELLKSNILECIGNERHYAIQSPTADFKISMQARNYLNRSVLRLPAGKPNEIELQTLIKARPAFVNSLVQQRKQAA